VWATLQDLAEIKGGLTLGKKRRQTDRLREVPYLRVANVQRGFLNLDEVKTVAATNSEVEDLRLLGGDILFNEGGDRDKLGRGWVWSGEIPECIHQNHVFRARLRSLVLVPKLVSMYANSFGQAYFLGRGKQTTNLASINLTKLCRLPIPVPPGNEQRRIVAKLETLLDRSRRAKEVLDAVPALIERFRRSVLAAAFRGDLTRDWREKNRDVEPASKLLERIRAERRRRWEDAELERMHKAPKDERWMDKYEEPAPCDPERKALPEGWCWATLEALCSKVTDGTHQPPQFQADGIPFLVIRNIIDGRIDWDGVTKWVSEPTYRGLTAHALPEKGDVLYTAVGSYGVAVEVEEDRPFAFQRHIAHLKPTRMSLLGSYLALVLNGPICKAQADAVARGVAQKTVTLGDLRRFAIPLAPRANADRLRQTIEITQESLDG